MVLGKTFFINVFVLVVESNTSKSLQQTSSAVQSLAACSYGKLLQIIMGC